MLSVFHMGSDMNNRMNQAGLRDETRRDAAVKVCQDLALQSHQGTSHSCIYIDKHGTFHIVCSTALELNPVVCSWDYSKPPKWPWPSVGVTKGLKRTEIFPPTLKGLGQPYPDPQMIRSVRFLPDRASSLSICHHHFLSQGRGERAYDIYSRLLRERIVCLMGPVSMTNNYMAIRRIHVKKNDYNLSSLLSVSAFR